MTSRKKADAPKSADQDEQPEDTTPDNDEATGQPTGDDADAAAVQEFTEDKVGEQAKSSVVLDNGARTVPAAAPPVRPADWQTEAEGANKMARALDVKDPASAKLDPPTKPVKQGQVPRESTLATDAAAEGLRVVTKVSYIRDENGERVNADDAFTDADAANLRTAKITLFQHNTATAWERKIATLLIAKGQKVSAGGAEAILNKIKAEPADYDTVG